MNHRVKGDDHDEDIQLFLGEGLKDVSKKGVIHVGAHVGEEVQHYLDHGFENIILIEANPDSVEILQSRFADLPNILIFGVAIANTTGGTINLNVHTSRSGSTEPASILAMARFTEIVPTLTTAKTVKVPVFRLDDLLEQHLIPLNDYNLITLDIQGAEMLALQGAMKTLEMMDAILTEVDLVELYEGSPSEREVVEFAESMGFKRVQSIFHELYDADSSFPAWGDILFVKD
ncbi:MAG: FkbM family methyltransferase [Verrucomicrobiota bacterium]